MAVPTTQDGAVQPPAWRQFCLGIAPVPGHIGAMADAARYQIQIGNILTEGFDAASDADAESIIADMCTGRASLSSLPPDTEIIITAPDGSSRATTLELSKRFR